MFSGIVSGVGEVLSVSPQGESTRLQVQSELFARSEDPLRVGDSVAHNGVCLTVVAVDAEAQRADFDVGSETLRCTTLGNWRDGQLINLERSLRMSDRLDGHLVQGHVDCVAHVQEIELQTSTYRVRITLPQEIAAYVAQRGSICVDGVSLTVGQLDAAWFEVFIIPHTWRVTAFHRYVVGTVVNLEADCLARYVAQAVAHLRQ